MKWFAWAAIALITILLAVLLTIRFAPQVLLKGVNLTSEFNTSAERIELKYFPPSVDLKNFKVSSKGKKFMEVETLAVDSTWHTLINNLAPISSVNIVNGRLDLSNIPAQSASGKNHTAKTKLDLFDLANLLRVKAQNLIIDIDESSNFVIHELDNALVKTEDKRAQLDINSRTSYQGSNTSLSLNTLTQLAKTDSGNSVSIRLQEVDLNSLLGTKQITEDTTQGEAEIDWSWLQDLVGSKLDLQIQDLRFPQGQIQQLDAQIQISEKIDAIAKGNLSLILENGNTIKEAVSLDLSLKPNATVTNNADASGHISVQSDRLSLSSEGDFNLNGFQENTIKVALEITELPRELNIDSEQLEQYLPAKLKAEINTQESNINIALLNAALANSDLRGDIEVEIISDEQNKVRFDLESEQLSYHSNELDALENEHSVESDDDQFLSKEPIDWAWLSSQNLQGAIKIATLNYQESVFKQISLPIKLQSKTLDIQPLTAQLTDGEIKLNLQIEQSDDGVYATTSFNFKDIDLSKSGLFEEGEVVGALSSGNMEIQTSGQSISQLAANSNGALFAEIGEGEIAQGSMDILGSDLVLSALSKLNPFKKPASATKLKCAIINLKIENGVLRAKNSIAMETSKVAIVGTGKVDLNNEQLNLKLNSKPKQSIGLNLSSLAQAVKLGGSLSQPSPEINTLGLAQTGLSLGAALSTGGLSLLAQGLIDDVTANYVCKNARKAFDDTKTEETIPKNDPNSDKQVFSTNDPLIDTEVVPDSKTAIQVEPSTKL